MWKPDQYESVADMILDLVPEYKSRSWKPFAVTVGWDPGIARFVRRISATRCDRRIASYMIPGELERSKGSIRFGQSKTGRGYREKRGDFCLVGGSYDKGHLTVFYRNVELLGGCIMTWRYLPRSTK